MVDRLDIENRICYYYCKFFALYVQSHYTTYLNSGGIERSNSYLSGVTAFSVKFMLER